MKRKQTTLIAAAVLCVAVIASCNVEPERPVPNPGFGLISTGQDLNGLDYFLRGARTTGSLTTTIITGESIIPSGATGTLRSFDVTTDFRSKALVPDAVAPAFWALRSVSGWDFFVPGGVFSGPRIASCNGHFTAGPINRGVYNTLICQERGRFLLPFGFSSINVSDGGVEFEMGANRVSANYGMPTFQFYDAYGTYVAQTTATAIDAENGIWAKGWSHCLAGLPAGTYSVDLINATWDGAGERVSSAHVYLYGASSANYIDDHRYFVAQQYRDLLGREPDTGGLDAWTAHITQCGNATSRQPGETYARCIVRKRVDVALGFWGSQEFFGLHPGVVNSSGTSAYNNSEFVRLCHVLYLQRNPTQAEQDFWFGHLSVENDYADVIKAFINSDEYRDRFQPPPTPICDPSWNEINSCQQQGGSWDYGGCWCVGEGGLYY